MHDEIVLVNVSTLVSDDEVDIWARAITFQLRHHMAPLWGLSGIPVRTHNSDTPIPHKAWPIFVMDHADQAGALGYHDETPAGLKYGRIFVQDCIDANVEPSTCASHEVCEAFGDASCNEMADNMAGVEVALESSDPVESNSYEVTVGDRTVLVSDFVTRAWFDPQSKGEQYNHLNTVKAPLSLAPGGYAIVRDASSPYSQVWGQIPAHKVAAKLQEGSRSSRRGLTEAVQVWAAAVAESGAGDAESGWTAELVDDAPYEHPEGFVPRLEGETYDEYVRPRVAEWNADPRNARAQIVPVPEEDWLLLPWASVDE